MKLEPSIIATGHGKPMEGKVVRRSLHHLSENFYELAVPASGRYVEEPAVADATGVIYVPPTNFRSRNMILKLLTVTAAISISYVLLHGKVKKKKRNRELLEYEAW